MFAKILAIIAFCGCANCILFKSEVNEISLNSSQCAILIHSQIKISDQLKGKTKGLLNKQMLKCDILLRLNTTAKDNKEQDSNSILHGIIETVGRLNNNGSIWLITGSDVVYNYLFSMALREMWDRNVQLFVMWQSKNYDESSLNLKKIAVITEGYFYDVDDNKQTTFENVLKNENVLGRYWDTFYVSESTKYVYIRISGIIKDVENGEITTSSGEKLNLMDQRDAVVFGDVYFKMFRVYQSGPWTVSMDAKKRVFVNVINENEHPLQNQARFSKLIAPQKTPNTLPAVSIEVGSDSELLAMPSKQVYVYFDVTNNQDQSLNAIFICTDTKNFVQQWQPTRIAIAPNETVTVKALIKTSTVSENLDIITFAINGMPNAQKMVYLYVNNEGKTDDVESPHLWYTLTSDCVNVLSSDCHTGTWTAEISAQDAETGLIQLISEPRGIYFNPDNYISGTKEEITGHYVGSCCKPELEITAVDLNRNKRSLQIDAYASTPLSAGVISAIVLGVILLIVAVIIIIYFIIRQKQKASLDLPTYRGPSGSKATL